jgi:hypothetical protein
MYALTPCSLSSNYSLTHTFKIAPQLNHYLDRVFEALRYTLMLRDQCEPLKKQRISHLIQEKETLDTIFAQTDLKICSTPHQFNEVTEEEYRKIKAVLENISSGDSKIIFDKTTSDQFRELILMDIAILLTRPISRELVYKLLEGKNSLTLIEANYSKYEAIGNLIYLHRSEMASHVALSQGMGYFCPAPRYITLAHEMIHALHDQLYGSECCDRLKTLKPTRGKNYDDLEEQMVISGYGENDYFEINEHTICQEFGLPFREDHRPGAPFSPNLRIEELQEDLHPLHHAAMSDALLNAQAWLAEGVDIDVKSSTGRTALHFAAGSGNLKMVDYLLMKGALATKKDDSGFTPLHLCAMGGSYEIAHSLIMSKATIQDPASNGKTPLMLGLDYRNWQVARALMENGALMQQQELDQHLERLIQSNELEGIKLFLQKGANVNAPHPFGSYLNYAVFTQNQPLIQLLLHFQADPTIQGPFGDAYKLAKEKNILPLLPPGKNL